MFQFTWYLQKATNFPTLVCNYFWHSPCKKKGQTQARAIQAFTICANRQILFNRQIFNVPTIAFSLLLSSLLFFILLTFNCRGECPRGEDCPYSHSARSVLNTPASTPRSSSSTKLSANPSKKEEKCSETSFSELFICYSSNIWVIIF